MGGGAGLIALPGAAGAGGQSRHIRTHTRILHEPDLDEGDEDSHVLLLQVSEPFLSLV